MKKFKKSAIFLLLLVLMLSCLSATAFAATDSKYGLAAEITTDKESYAAGEEILLKITVSNTNSFGVKNVLTKGVLPDGLKIKSGELTAQSTELSPGQSIVLSAVVEKESGIPEPSTASPETATEIPVNQNANSPKTEDTSHVLICIVWLLLSLVTILLVWKRRKKAFKILSLILCIGLLACTLQVIQPPVAAAEEVPNGSFSISQDITIDGTCYSILVNISYDKDASGEMPMTEITSFKTDTYDILLNQQTNVVFEAVILSDEEIGSEDVAVYSSDGEMIGYLLDDGVGVDDIAGDGTYTGNLSLLSSKIANVSFHAEVLGVKSDEVEICFYEPFEQSDFEPYFEFKQSIQDLEADYLDTDGFVRPGQLADLLKTIENFVKNQLSEGNIKEYKAENNTVFAVLNSGIQYIYLPPLPDVDSGTDEKKIATYQPCDSGYPQYIQSISSGCVDGSAVRIADLPDDDVKYLFTKNSNNSDVTLDELRSISNYGVILWHGHGGYTNSLHSFLVTGDTLDESKFLWDPVYYIQHIGYTADYLSGRFILSGNTICVTYKFFEKYLHDMNGAFVYLAACSSGKDSVLANTFRNKGASTVFANSDTIHTVYNLNMMRAVVEAMTTPDANGKYHSASQALQQARSVHGAIDTVLEDNGTVIQTQVQIFGDNNFRFINLEGNYGFERGKIGWKSSGDFRVISKLGTLDPTENNYMAIVGTGLGAVSDSNSSLYRSFPIPENMTRLSFDYDFVSEEPMEYVGSKYDDTLQIYVNYTLDGQNFSKMVVQETVNSSAWVYLGGNYFNGGDDTTYHTTWKTYSIDLTPEMINAGSIEVLVKVWDQGDSIYDSAVLVDNFRFAA